MIVEPGLKLWGSERALAATLKSLTEAWGRVVLVVPQGAELADEVRQRPDDYGLVDIREVSIGNLHKRGYRARLFAMMALALLMIRLRPDRVYLNQAGLARLMQPLSRLMRFPLAIHVRLIEDVTRIIHLRGTTRAPLDVIFISDAMLEAAAGIVLPAGTQWHMAYDPYPLAQFPELRSQSAPFVCVGRLSQSKGPHLLVEALSNSCFSDVTADIFGAGVDGDSYADKLTDLVKPVQNRVRLMGFHRDVISHLPAYRFLVSTSHFETLGRVIMEAWEAGVLPIVYAGSGGAAEMVQKSGGGILFENWDAASLSVALRRALSMPENERLHFVDGGRSWMAESLNLQVYRTVLTNILY